MAVTGSSGDVSVPPLISTLCVPANRDLLAFRAHLDWSRIAGKKVQAASARQFDQEEYR